MSTTECDKMLAVRDQSQIIGEFIEWLQNSRGEGLRICKLFVADPDDPGRYYRWSPYTPDIEQLLAEFFDIDLGEVEREKRAILSRQQLVSERGQ